LIDYRALLMECGALLIEYRVFVSLLKEFRALSSLLTDCRALSMENRALFLSFDRKNSSFLSCDGMYRTKGLMHLARAAHALL